jgi:spore germination protein GerM
LKDFWVLLKYVIMLDFDGFSMIFPRATYPGPEVTYVLYTTTVTNILPEEIFKSGHFCRSYREGKKLYKTGNGISKTAKSIAIKIY